MLCTQCGTENARDARLCHNCGSALSREDALTEESGGGGAREFPPDESSLVAQTAASAVCGSRVDEGKEPRTSKPEDHATSSALPAADAGDIDDRKKSALYGVRGWLLFFCICITIIGPLFLLAQAATGPRSAYSVVADVVLGAFSIDTGVTLWRKRPHALRLLKIYFIVMTALYLLVALASVALYLRAPGAVAGANADRLRGVVGGLAGLVVWMMYFRRSKRVKTTFGRNL